MNVTKSEIAAIGIVLVAFGVSAYFYQQMPESIACHWDLRGNVDGYMSKAPGLFIMPGIIAVFVSLLVIVPRVVSVSANIEGFRRFYGGFVILFSIFLLLAQYQMILWNLGIEINPLAVILVMAPAFIIWIAVWMYRAQRKRRIDSVVSPKS
jgi:uncharacterized membrane protein